MQATLEGLAAVRVRDVEIALVLAREMKAAAERDVDASLRLLQLQEVFGAESLDRGERARIQTALEMAGLNPMPSLLEADPSEPIRFALAGPDGERATASAAPVEPAAAPVEKEPQEFPTVGEFARSAFRRFRTRRARAEGDGGEQVATATGEQAPAPSPAVPAPEPEP